MIGKEQHALHVKQNRTRRHLVVDDAETNRRLMELYLQTAAAGIVVDCADSGNAALEIVKTIGVDAYDVVWTDLMMEGMDGIELVTNLREMGFKGYVVVLTGHTKDAVVDAWLDPGVDEVLLKPIRKKALHDMPIMQIYV